MHRNEWMEIVEKMSRLEYDFDQYVTLDTFNMYTTTVTEIQLTSHTY